MHYKHFWQAIATLFVSLFLTLGYLFLPQSIFSLDDRLRDFLFVLRGPIPHSDKIVIVDIDEKSLAQYGRWPWSRERIAQLVDTLSAKEAGIIGMDMIFPEADNTSPHHLAKAWGIKNDSLKNYDQILAESFKQNPVIGGYLFLFEPSEETRSPFSPSVIIEHRAEKHDYIPQAKSVLLNITLLQEAYYSSGFLNNISDQDGVIRSVPLLMRYHSQLYLSLSMEMLRIYFDANKIEIINNETGVEGVGLSKRFIPTERFGNLYINFRGSMEHFTYVSAADVMNNTVDTKVLQNKLVLVGTSAIGLGDVHATPFDNAMAGVEVHANIIDNIIQGDFIAPPINGVVYNMIIIVLTTALSVLLFSTLPRRTVFPAILALFVGYYFLFSWLLFEKGIILSLLFALLALILGTLSALMIDYFDEARKKERAQDEVKETTATMLEQSKSAAMGEMVGMIAHQWRQPLSSMSAISSKVKLKGELGQLDSVDKEMDEVVDLTRYLSDTIEDFRNFFKEDKSFDVTPLEVVVDRSIRFTSHLLKTKDVTVTKNLHELSARLNVNEITQVVINLIKNAVDAYEERGIQERTLHFEAEEHDGLIFLHVSDCAGGLDEKKLAKIFEKSFSTKGAEGTGLGLYMSRKIIEQNHHGALHVSNRDGGLRFSIALPTL
jgi:CHASE2 domain-containing sensor protein